MSSFVPAPLTPRIRVYRICFGVGLVLLAASLGLGFRQVAASRGRAPGLSRDLMDGAREALAHGRTRAALREFRKAADVSPDDYRLLLSSAEGLAQNGDFDGALALADRAERLRPGDSRAPSVRGWALLLGGRTSEAYASFLAALSRNPNDAAALAGVAEGLAAQRRYDEATRLFARSVAADPRRVETRDGYGIALALAGLPGAAV
jgi:Flp pilus assembly protein TadD